MTFFYLTPLQATTSNGDVEDHRMVRDPHTKVRDVEPPRRGIDARPPPLNTAYNDDHASHSSALSPKTPTPGHGHMTYPRIPQYENTESGSNHVTYPSSPQSPHSPPTPVTPRFPINDVGPSQSVNEDEFTRVSLYGGFPFYICLAFIAFNVCMCT